MARPVIYNKLNHHAFDGTREWLLSIDERSLIYDKKTDMILIIKSDVEELRNLK